MFVGQRLFLFEEGITEIAVVVTVAALNNKPTCWIDTEMGIALKVSMLLSLMISEKQNRPLIKDMKAAKYPYS